MPAWRKLHQKTTESLDLNEMPDDFTRLLWLLLPLGLDREGRGLDNPSWVKAKLMPLRTDIALEQIAAALDCFAARGMIQRYQVDGRHYFALPTWRKYQGDTSREATSSFPPPPTPGAAPPTPGAAPPACSDGLTAAAQDQHVSASRLTHDQLVSNSRPDSDTDSDLEIDSEAEADSPDPPAGSGVRDFPDPSLLYCQSYHLPRLTPAQERSLTTLGAAYGPNLLAEVIAWAVQAGIPHPRALRAITSALPGWNTTARSPNRAARREGTRTPMLEVLDQLSQDYQRDRRP